ncbi:MAG TPA: MmcQ/YjbR family DNA-binding protein [Streptosporangiaceae bacterium]|nr:MmcQ/YjbR family DNA-binding protein [Streptosporangiaceae bacterium]
MSDFEHARRFALSLPGVTEEPHFDLSSYRVRGKIFATAPPGGSHLHVFLDELAVEAAVAEDPAAFEPLRWGRQVRGVRILLAAAAAERVTELIDDAWRRRAPRQLVAEFDAGQIRPDPAARAPD